MLLPIEMINYILTFEEKELYRNKYTKQMHIRFIPTIYDKFMYLFTAVHNGKNGDNYQSIIYRPKLRVSYLNLNDKTILTCFYERHRRFTI
jgi:hypothetical protein